MAVFGGESGACHGVYACAMLAPQLYSVLDRATRVCHSSPQAYDRFGGSNYYEARAWLSKRLPFPLAYTVPRLMSEYMHGKYLDHMDSHGMQAIMHSQFCKRRRSSLFVLNAPGDRSLWLIM